MEIRPTNFIFDYSFLVCYDVFGRFNTRSIVFEELLKYHMNTNPSPLA